MLRTKTDGSEKLKVYGILIGIEIEDGIDIDLIMKKVGETLHWYPGTGTVDLELLGEIEVIEDQIAVVNDIDFSSDVNPLTPSKVN